MPINNKRKKIGINKIPYEDKFIISFVPVIVTTLFTVFFLLASQHTDGSGWTEGCWCSKDERKYGFYDASFTYYEDDITLEKNPFCDDPATLS